jgi:hypothetical protein
VSLLTSRRQPDGKLGPPPSDAALASVLAHFASSGLEPGRAPPQMRESRGQSVRTGVLRGAPAMMKDSVLREATRFNFGKIRRCKIILHGKLRSPTERCGISSQTHPRAKSGLRAFAGDGPRLRNLTCVGVDNLPPGPGCAKSCQAPGGHLRPLRSKARLSSQPCFARDTCSMRALSACTDCVFFHDAGVASAQRARARRSRTTTTWNSGAQHRAWSARHPGLVAGWRGNANVWGVTSRLPCWPPFCSRALMFRVATASL